MISLMTVILAAASTTPVPSSVTDTTALALSIVDEMKREAGLMLDSGGEPLAGGPFYLDSQSINQTFSFLYGTAVADDVENALALDGYSFVSPDTMATSTVDSTGVSHRFIRNDAIIGQLEHVNIRGLDAEARVTILFTFVYHSGRRTLCHRTVDLKFVDNAGSWHATDSNIVSQC